MKQVKELKIKIAELRYTDTEIQEDKCPSEIYFRYKIYTIWKNP